MYFTKFIFCIILATSLFGCGDNLVPSGEDKRPTVTAGSTGGAVSQKSPDFSVSDTKGGTVTLQSSTAGKKGAAFYFTMWCPICDSHMSNMRSSIMPSFPDVNFYLVDYVSGSVSSAAAAASENGYGTMNTLADSGHTLLNTFGATMGTTIVIDKDGIIRMNEDYKDGTVLKNTLNSLQ